MSGRGQQERRLWLALVAAYVLLLQSLFSAYAQGVGAGADALPLAALCSVDQIDHGHGAPAGNDHHHLPDCCGLGCAMFAPWLPLLAGGALLPPRPDHLLYHDRPPAGGIITASLRYQPGNPRAPPAGSSFL